MNAKTPEPMKTYMAEQIREINKNPEVSRKLEQQGLVPRTLVRGEFDQYIAQEMNKFGKILKSNK